MAQIVYHGSTGKSLSGHQVYSQLVRYLVLEDQYCRIQERTVRMFGVEYQDNLLIAVSEKQVEYFLGAISAKKRLCCSFRKHRILYKNALVRRGYLESHDA